MACRPPIGLSLGVCILLAGCSGSLGDALGLGKRAPDEFAVVKRQPLIIPPDFDLRPPDPNARGPVAARADTRARSALTGVSVGSSTTAGAASDGGEAVLVRRTAEVQGGRTAGRAGGVETVDAGLFEGLTGPDVDGVPDPAPDGELTLIRRSSTPLEDL